MKPMHLWNSLQLEALIAPNEAEKVPACDGCWAAAGVQSQPQGNPDPIVWDKNLGQDWAGDLGVVLGSQELGQLETGHPMGQNTATPQRGLGPSPCSFGK